ncbi:transcriptional regulator [Brevundimonas intermedia]|uniref:Transcriptional regulator n=1 Tax=Brevundimonas intermedia TaxID=74315 RepID=A0ABQ5T5T0_9CAUL|nr:LysR family transcriptional regulator [Brevundimonas intermedia]GLK47678.1 transcriptional regulator [Brevundimonas intermedia]
MFDWDDLRVFAVLARLGSLTAAARALNVNHATVGRRVAALEAALGAPLIVRLPRSTPLTPQGQAIAAAAQEMEAAADAVTRRAKTLAATLTGPISISLPPALASGFLAERLPTFQSMHPTLSVTLLATSTITSLERGEADIAIRLVRPDGPAQIRRRLGEMRLGLYAAPAVARSPASGWRFILSDTDQADLPHQAWLAHYAGDRPVAIRSSDIHTQIAAARAGLGVAAIPHFMANRLDLAQVDAAADVPSRTIWLVVHEGVRKAPAVQAAAAWLTESFATSPFRG